MNVPIAFSLYTPIHSITLLLFSREVYYNFWHLNCRSITQVHNYSDIKALRACDFVSIPKF